ncbi:sugar phosphate isomerase/epimerase family protein [Pelagibacterium lacus]|nr:sugar phosphate isomerase/epimerase [Pelagibacterium lacus]
MDADISKISLAQLGFYDAGPVALISAAAEAGFGAVSLLGRSGIGKRLEHDLVSDRDLRAQVREHALQTGMRISDIETIVLDPDLDLAALDPLFDLAADLGARHISCIGPRLGSGSDPAALAAQFAAICTKAASTGVDIGVEFMGFREIGTLEQALLLIERSGASNAKVILDCLHLHRTGASLQVVASLDAERIACVQLSDAPVAYPRDLMVEARAGRMHPGTGTIALSEILACVPPSVPLVLEVPGAVRAEDAVATRTAEAALHLRAFLTAIATY